MTLSTDLVRTDQQHLIHPLHDHSEPVIYVRGCGAKVYDINGREYIDGLSGLWNVNVGHGRAALADAAAAQMKELAFFSGYAGSANTNKDLPVRSRPFCARVIRRARVSLPGP